MILAMTQNKLFLAREGSCVRRLGPLTDPLFLLFNTRVWKSLTGFPWRNCRTVGKTFRQGGLASVVKGRPDVMRCCAGGHCIALERARSLSISFLWHWALDPHPLLPVLWGVPSRNLVLGKSELFLEKLMFLQQCQRCFKILFLCCPAGFCLSGFSEAAPRLFSPQHLCRLLAADSSSFLAS